jgi:hypothetical protein
MQMTLLDMTQNILSALSSDEVNSISDTTESMQVATIIRNKYFDIINRVDLTEHDQLIQLDPSLDPTIPVQMFVPDGVAEIKWLKYFNSNVLDNGTPSGHGINVDLVSLTNWTTTSTTSNTIGLGSKTFTVASSLLPITVNQTVIAESGANSMTGTVVSYIGTTLVLNVTSVIGSGTFTSWVIASDSGAAPVPGYEYVTILPVKQFIDMVNTFNPAETNVQSFVFTNSVNGFPGTYTFYYKIDRQPTFCCILSNFNIIFDAYDNTQDTTLQASKSMAWGRVIPVFLMQDGFIPDLDDEQFTLLLNESKALAYFELKQSIHPKAEQEIKRGWSSVQKNKSVANRPSYFDALPDFGRRQQGFNSPVSYFKSRRWDSSNG